jgi:hypothetical protein
MNIKRLAIVAAIPLVQLLPGCLQFDENVVGAIPKDAQNAGHQVLKQAESATGIELSETLKNLTPGELYGAAVHYCIDNNISSYETCLLAAGLFDIPSQFSGDLQEIIRPIGAPVGQYKIPVQEAIDDLTSLDEKIVIDSSALPLERYLLQNYKELPGLIKMGYGVQACLGTLSMKLSDDPNLDGTTDTYRGWCDKYRFKNIGKYEKDIEIMPVLDVDSVDMSFVPENTMVVDPSYRVRYTGRGGNVYKGDVFPGVLEIEPLEF